MDIMGYKDYVIHWDGDVWSRKRKIFLKPSIGTPGYHQVGLVKDGKQHTKMIHRLVALHYIPNPDNLPQVDHRDGNKLNNHVSNLRWVTQMTNLNSFQVLRSNNQCGHKNIYYEKGKKYGYWKFHKTIYGVRYWKTFKTLEEALKYKQYNSITSILRYYGCIDTI